jgi:hypothetical protein
MESRVLFPTGDATKLTPAYAATISVTAWNTQTIVDLGTITGDVALTVLPDAELRIGSRLLLKVKATANADDVTLGAGIDAPVIVGVAGKTKTQEFVWDGIVFVPAGAIVQID